MAPEDRIRLHNLLDYAIYHNEEYVIAQFAVMDFEYHVKMKRYKMLIKTEEDVITRKNTGVDPD